MLLDARIDVVLFHARIDVVLLDARIEVVLLDARINVCAILCKDRCFVLEVRSYSQEQKRRRDFFSSL